jgi:hypothetical protein
VIERELLAESHRATRRACQDLCLEAKHNVAKTPEPKISTRPIAVGLKCSFAMP